jgi:RNA polymerase sigma factor (sigma-70 family)
VTGHGAEVGIVGAHEKVGLVDAGRDEQLGADPGQVAAPGSSAARTPEPSKIAPSCRRSELISLRSMSTSDERSRLLGSLAEIRGFVTHVELEHASPAPHAQLPDDPFERLAERSGNRSRDAGAGTALDRLLTLRVETVARCLVGLSAELLQVVARDAKQPIEDLGQLQTRMAAALAHPDERAAALAVIRDTADIAGLVGPLHQHGAWPGDPTCPLVRAYREVLAEAVAQHSRLAFWGAARWIRDPPRIVLLLALDGLAEAIERFDERRGFRLATYATSWIRQRVQRGHWTAVMAIRVPIHLREKLVRLRHRAQTVVVREGRTPDLGELLSPRPDEAPSSDLAAFLNAPTNVWDIPGANNESELDRLFADDHLTPARAELRRHLTELLRGVTFKQDRYREILARRYGLDTDDDGETLETIGEAFGLTRERIRQLENLALKRLAGALGSKLAALR